MRHFFYYNDNYQRGNLTRYRFLKNKSPFVRILKYWYSSFMNFCNSRKERLYHIIFYTEVFISAWQYLLKSCLNIA